MYQFIPLQRDYLCEPSLKANVATDEGKDQNETWTLKKEMNLEWLCKVGAKSVLNSWPDSSVGQSVWTQFSGHGFKSQSGQLSIATSKNPSVANTIYKSIHYATDVTNCARFRLTKMWWLMKTVAKSKLKTGKKMKLQYLYKAGSECELK